MTVAINDQTGEVLVFDGASWVPPKIAVNDQTGERVFYDGQAWKPMPMPVEGTPSPAGAIPQPPPPAPLTPTQQLNQNSFGSPNLDPPAEPPRKFDSRAALRQQLTLPGPDHKNNLELALENAPPMRGAQMAGNMAAGAVGMPVDLANLALNIPGMVLNAAGRNVPEFKIPGGSQDIKNLGAMAAEYLGLPLEDFNKLQGAERTAVKGTISAGESALGVGAIKGAAKVMPNSRVVQALNQPYDEAQQLGTPMRPVIGDLAAGAGAGVVGDTMDQAGVNSPVAKMAGSMAGGVGGQMALRAAADGPVAVGRAVYEHFAKDPITGATIRESNLARRMAQDLATDPKRAAQNIDNEVSYLRDAGVPDGSMPTTGLMSNDPGLIAAERADSTRRIPRVPGMSEELRTEALTPGDFAERYRAVGGEASRRVQSVNPGGEPRLAQQFVEADAAQQRQAVQQPLTKAQQEAEDLRLQNHANLLSEQTKQSQLIAEADLRVLQAKQRAAEADTAERDLGGTVAGRAGGETAASEALAKKVAEQKAADEATKSALYRDAAESGKATQIDPTPLADTAKAVRDEISPLAGQDPKLNNILGDLERLGAKQEAPREAAGFVPQAPEAPPAPQTISARDLVDMLPRLSQARDSASRLMRGDVVEKLDTISRSVRGELNKLADAGDEGALKWREAETNFREDFAPKYRQGVGKDLDQAERAGSPVEPSAVAGKFIKPGAGGKEAASDLKRILGEDGEKAAREYVLADMAGVVGSDGKVNPARLKTWINQRAGMFEVLPSLKAEAEGVLADVVNKRKTTSAMQRELEGAALERKNLGATTQKQIDEIRANAKLTEAQKADQIKALEQKVKDMERSIKDAPASLLLGADPEVAARELFSGRDPQMQMRGIVAKLKSDPEALKAWKTAVAKHLEDSTTNATRAQTDDATRAQSFAKLDNLFQQHDKTLRELFDAGEMNQLRAGHRLVMNLERRNVRSTTNSATSEYNINEKDLRPVEIMAKLYYGQLKGGGIMRSIKLALPNIPGANDAEKAGLVIRRAWMDPPLMKHLLTTPAPGPSAARWNRKLNTLMGLQEAGVESSDGE